MEPIEADEPEPALMLCIVVKKGFTSQHFSTLFATKSRKSISIKEIRKKRVPGTECDDVFVIRVGAEKIMRTSRSL